MTLKECGTLGDESVDELLKTPRQLPQTSLLGDVKLPGVG